MPVFVPVLLLYHLFPHAATVVVWPSYTLSFSHLSLELLHRSEYFRQQTGSVRGNLKHNENGREENFDRETNTTAGVEGRMNPADEGFAKS